MVKLSDFYNYKDINSQFSDSFIKNSKAVKFSQDNNCCQIVITSTTPKKTIKSIQQSLFPLEINFINTTDSDFTEFIGNIVEKNDISKNSSTTNQNFSLDNISLSSPAVNILNAICASAVRQNASDIHIEPYENNTQIRYRIDGILKTVKILDKDFLPFLSSRIKVMANLNIMETRLPQDGSIHVSLNNSNYHFRVSTIPLTDGESIVLRFFSIENQNISLNELGFSKDQQKLLLKAINRSSGLIIVTGPTGSGKSTTIHSLLSTLDSQSLKIITIEDPIERILPGVNQIQVNEDIGLTFDGLLKRILRQDPDVIMIGEIRDKETASLAIRASLTGHLVITTMHTTSSTECFSRLRDLGIDNSMIASTLYCCIAQRLIRKTKGRTCIAEMFILDQTIQDYVEQNKTSFFIRNYLIKHGFSTLHDQALLKIKSHDTTAAEIKRIGLYE